MKTPSSTTHKPARVAISRQAFLLSRKKENTFATVNIGQLGT